jgi:hypothetical protein
MTSEFVRRGFAELRRDNLDAAREAFAAAWERRPAAVVALSLAQVEMRLGHFVQAAAHWQFLLLHLPSTLSDQRAAAAEQLELCRTHVGSLTLQVAPDGATIVVDDKPIGQAPLRREVFLEPGTHTVYASHAGRRSDERSFRISAGSRLSFRLAIADAPPAPTPSAAVPSTTSTTRAADAGGVTRAESSSIRQPVLIAGAILAASSAALGTYFAINASRASDNASAARAAAERASDPSIPRNRVCAVPAPPESCAELAQSTDDMDRFRNLSLATFVGAGALGAATLAGFVFWKDSGTARAPTSGSRFSIAPRVGPTNGLELVGSF